MMSVSSLTKILMPGLFLAGIVAGWELIARYQLVSPVFLPSASSAGQALFSGLLDGPLLLATASTIERMFYGWFAASLAGVALGCLIGISSTARALLQPTLEFFRPLPASSIVPVAIAFFGLSQAMVVFVIAFGSMWPALLGAVQGVVSVEPRLYELAKALRMTRLETIWKIALPNALPDIFAGMKIGLAIALILTVVGEFLAGQEGLGLSILQAARRFRADDLFAGVMLLGFIGLGSTFFMSFVEAHLLRWRPKNPGW